MRGWGGAPGQFSGLLGIVDVDAEQRCSASSSPKARAARRQTVSIVVVSASALIADSAPIPDKRRTARKLFLYAQNSAQRFQGNNWHSCLDPQIAAEKCIFKVHYWDRKSTCPKSAKVSRTSNTIGRRHYLETSPDPIAMVIRVELFIHKPRTVATCNVHE